MSSRKGSSTRNSSSHSSSGDSPANQVIAPKEEFEVEEEAKDAVLQSSFRLASAFARHSDSQEAREHWRGVLILSYELGMDFNPGDFERFWFTRGTGIDGSYRMAPKKGMAIIQAHTSHPKAWFEHFFFVRIDGEFVEESYLHLFRREWNFTHGKGVASENVLGNLPLPEWNPGFSPGERSGTS
uniref:Uncharacterized protein n=1 Tax=Brassica oleracea var. oleracea TaxID=109376 RepID=A0A0D3D273_BRAOL